MIDWKLPWRELPPESVESRHLQGELKKELADKHFLHGKVTAVIGRRNGTDDVLVLLEDGRCAVVHLTWAGRVSGLPEKFPWFAVYDSLEIFCRDRMNVDAEVHDAMGDGFSFL